ncbi:hypothetical protein [Legionella sp. WA2024007413]
MKNDEKNLSRMPKRHRKRHRKVQIEEYAPDVEYEREKLLIEEGKALAELAKPQEKIYRCVEINEKAKSLFNKLNAITAHLQEQMEALEHRLEESMPRSARILLLEKYNKLMKAGIENIGQVETDLSAIEKDLFPKLDYKIHGGLFARNKSAVAELYARLKQRSFQIQYKLEGLDPQLKNMIILDLERLNKLLSEIELISEKTSQIYANLQSGRIDADLYSAMANQLYEINEKKFEFEQVCKLIEDKVELSKLDKEIAQQVEELKALNNGWSSIKNIIDAAYFNPQRGKADLATQLKLVNFSFNAADYEPKLCTSSMEWDDDLTTREAMIIERQNIIAQLSEKRKDFEQVKCIIATHQQTIKDLVAKDLEFCVKRVNLYEALTKAPHDFYRRFDNYQKVLEYDFNKGLDNPLAQWHLYRLLSYTLGYLALFPDNCTIVRNVKNASTDLKKLKEQFETDFPQLTVKGAFFNYKKKSYLLSDSLREKIDNYILAHAKITDAFETGEKWASYAEAVDFQRELELLKTSKTAIEQYIVAYESDQVKNRSELLDIKIQLSKLFPKLSVQNSALEYQGELYTLDVTTAKLVEEYNRVLKELKSALNDKDFSLDPISVNDKKEQFAVLKNTQKLIISFLKEQKQNRLELLEIKKQFANHTQFSVEKRTLLHQENTYTLDLFTEQKVEHYNILHTRLTSKFRNPFSTESISSKVISLESLEHIKRDFDQLKEDKTAIYQFIKKQIDFSVLIRDFSKYSLLTLNEKGELVHKGKTYLLNAEIQKQVQDYNKTYTQLTMACQSSENIENATELFKELQQKESPFKKIDEFGKLMDLLQKQRELVQKKKSFVNQIQDSIDKEIKRENCTEGSEQSKINDILSSLLTPFREYSAQIEQLERKIKTNQEDLRLDNLDNSKEQIQTIAVDNQKNTDALIERLKGKFIEDLPTLSSGKYLNQFMEWIDKKIIAPLYEVYYKKEKPYRPGLFATSAEVNLFAFRQQILPNLEVTQKETHEAAKAATAA